MKSVLISIHPRWCELIASGKKTVEARKTKPKIPTPFKCYIYQTKKTWIYDIYSRIADWQGKVIGEFVCDAIITDKTFGHDDMFNTAACLTAPEIAAYFINNEMYGWHISSLVIYDKPKELGTFNKADFICPRGIQKENCVGCWECQIIRAPQSWCYVEEIS